MACTSGNMTSIIPSVVDGETIFVPANDGTVFIDNNGKPLSNFDWWIEQITFIDGTVLPVGRTHNYKQPSWVTVDFTTTFTDDGDSEGRPSFTVDWTNFSAQFLDALIGVAVTVEGYGEQTGQFCLSSVIEPLMVVLGKNYSYATGDPGYALLSVNPVTLDETVLMDLRNLDQSLIEPSGYYDVDTGYWYYHPDAQGATNIYRTNDGVTSELVIEGANFEGIESRFIIVNGKLWLSVDDTNPDGLYVCNVDGVLPVTSMRTVDTFGTVADHIGAPVYEPNHDKIISGFDGGFVVVDPTTETVDFTFNSSVLDEAHAFALIPERQMIFWQTGEDSATDGLRLAFYGALASADDISVIGALDIDSGTFSPQMKQMYYDPSSQRLFLRERTAEPHNLHYLQLPQNTWTESDTGIQVVPRAVVHLRQAPVDVFADEHPNLYNPTIPTWVYWTDSGTGDLMRYQVDGGGTGAPVTLDASLGSGVRGLCVDRTNGKIYVCERTSNNVYWYDLDGSNKAIVSTAATDPDRVRIFDNKLYISSFGDGVLIRCDLDGSNPETILSGLTFATKIWITANNLWVTRWDLGLTRYDWDGSSATNPEDFTVDELNNVGDVVITPDGLYYLVITNTDMEIRDVATEGATYFTSQSFRAFNPVVDNIYVAITGTPTSLRLIYLKPADSVLTAGDLFVQLHDFDGNVTGSAIQDTDWS